MLNEQEEEKILARFAIIKNKQDYVDLINTLQEIANKRLQDLISPSVKDKTEQ